MVAGDRIIHRIRLAAVGGNVEGVLIRSGPAGDGHRHPLAGSIVHPHAIGAISTILAPVLKFFHFSGGSANFIGSFARSMGAIY